MNGDLGTIFITGLSASGKSTMGQRLKDGLIKSGINNVMLLDGEDVREQLAKRGLTFGYSKEDRIKVALQIAHLAAEYNKKGYICIICSICHIKELREEMRGIIGNVFEVYLDCSVDVCARRDYKGNYAKAFKGQCDDFVGVAEPYQRSDHVELVLHTGKDPIDRCSSILLSSAMGFIGAKAGELVEKEGVVS
jgi:adenylylsulfate kinase-like enzyme